MVFSVRAFDRGTAPHEEIFFSEAVVCGKRFYAGPEIEFLGVREDG